MQAVYVFEQIFSIIPERPDQSHHFPPVLCQLTEKILFYFINANGEVYQGQFCPN